MTFLPVYIVLSMASKSLLIAYIPNSSSAHVYPCHSTAVQFGLLVGKELVAIKHPT